MDNLLFGIRTPDAKTSRVPWVTRVVTSHSSARLHVKFMPGQSWNPRSGKRGICARLAVEYALVRRVRDTMSVLAYCNGLRSGAVSRRLRSAYCEKTVYCATGDTSNTQWSWPSAAHCTSFDCERGAPSPASVVSFTQSIAPANQPANM